MGARKIILTLICFVWFINNGLSQFSFIHITDLHFADGLSAGGYDLNGAMFKQLKNAINNISPKPAFVVATGDISHAGDFGGDGMYTAFTHLLYPDTVSNPGTGSFYIDSLQTIPIYFTTGNHDFRYTNTPPLGNSMVKYQAYLCTVPDYAIVYQNAVIICMNSGYDDLRPLWEDTNYMSPESSGFSNEQLSWLRGILANNSTKRKIIAMHSPPVNKVGLYCDGTVFSGTFVDYADGSIKYNRDVFLNICDSNNVDVVLAGHAHQNIVVSKTGVTVDENWTDSTRYVQTGAALDGCYRIISIDSAFVTVGVPQSVQPAGIFKTHTEQKIKSVSIFPNPFHSTATLSISKNITLENTDFLLYDFLGREVLKIQNIKDYETEIKSAGMKAGIYFYLLLNINAVVDKGRVIIR